mmetsp:Transcript_2187/g.5564  ORF Transcript_2187/g.5564 Transcript_2187/m.5564 type:complete len:310 (+) Transcript_2187:96-1025(+)
MVILSFFPVLTAAAALQAVAASALATNLRRPSEAAEAVTSNAIAKSISSEPSCKALVLTTYFTSVPDWQRGGTPLQKANPMVVHSYYRRVMPIDGLTAILIHDGLPDNIVKTLSEDGKFIFKKVDPWQYDPNLGANDVRFLIFRDILQNHPEFPVVFTTDLFDVKILRSPCSLVANSPGRLFVGSEVNSSFSGGWMRGRFEQLGGSYLSWYEQEVAKRDDKVPLFNAGVLGGKRQIYLEFLNDIIRVLEDPDVKARHGEKHQQVNVNMAALNYVVRSNATRLMEVFTGHPLHSEFGAYMALEGDCFKHK